MKRFFGLLLWVCLAQPLVSRDHFVLYDPDNLIVQKSQGFIQSLSGELKNKTGFSLYVVAVDDFGGKTKQDRNTFKKRFLSQLSDSYAVIFFFKSHQKIDIVIEPDLGIDRGEIISRYMVPILMQDKEMSPAKISASLLNGYAQLANEIAHHFGVSLERNLIVDQSGVADYIHYIIYVMLGSMFGLIGLIYLTRKKK